MNHRRPKENAKSQVRRAKSFSKRSPLSALRPQPPRSGRSPSLRLSVSRPPRSGRSPLSALSSQPHRSGGAVIIIVLTLLATLAFLGFFFYEWTDQEQLAARGYASAEDYEINPNEILDQAWEQVLVGTRPGFEPSALWGGRHSILSHIIGPVSTTLSPLDDHPFSGTGIDVTYVDADSSGTYNIGEQIYFDYDGDGSVDRQVDATAVADALALNFSRVARADTGNYSLDIFTPTTDQARQVFLNFRPDTGVTYPDVNNLFLGYDATVGGARVIIPSFMRPQLEITRRNAGTGGFNNYFADPLTASRSLRPHLEHRLVDGGTSRFISPIAFPNGVAAQSGNTNRIIRPFTTGVDLDGDNQFNDLGVLSGRTDGLYELDVDTDGDGVRDAIWMDLGLPMIDLPDGRQVVPLVAVRILDADALLNVNLHGNIQGHLAAGEAPNLPNNSISKSNQGLSPAEVNPLWALMADANMATPAVDPPAGTTLNEFGAMNVMPANSLDAANMELMFLLMGRRPADGTSTLAGRNGEAALMEAYVTGGFVGPRPLAGFTGVDDDFDSFRGGDLNAHVETSLSNIAVPPAVHPLDFGGTGNLYNGNGYLEGQSEGAVAGATRRLGPTPSPLADNPSVWPVYLGRWHDHALNSVATTYPTLPMSLSGVAGLQTAGTNDLVNEDNELTANRWFPNTADDVFAPSEMAALHLSLADFALTGEYSRLRDLLPFAFRDAESARINRGRFTTDSWDRLEFASALRNVGRDDYPNSAIDDPAPRFWEYNTWGTADYPAPNIYFPPRFPGAGSDPFDRVPATSTGNPTTDAQMAASESTDPLRWELRRLLLSRIIYDGSNAQNYDAGRISPRLRLNLNKILVGFDNAGNPIERPLTPHPGDFTTATGVLADMYHGQHVERQLEPPPAPYSTAPAFANIGSDAMVQEWWARYDRQRMARDLYTLLWITSAGNDLNDYTTTVDDPTVDDSATADAREDDDYDVAAAADLDRIRGRDRVREMAQFAVNVVDALDRDNVITAFRYDEDLTDGWDLIDTNLSTAYGVEAAQLTFSEGLAVQTPAGTDSRNLVEYEDSTLTRYHLFVELRNASPFNVAIDNNQWRLRRIDLVDAEPPPTTPKPNLSVTLQDTVTNNILPGDLYLIGTHDGGNEFPTGNPRPSDLRIDYDQDGDYDAIAPNIIETTPPTNATDEATYPSPLCDLDLMHGSHSGRFTPGADNAPGMLDPSSVPTSTTGPPTIRLALERRLSPDAVGLTDLQNPWVEVDRIAIPLTTLNIANTTDPITNLTTALKSVERRDPFDPKILPDAYAGADQTRANTMPYLTAAAAGPGTPQRNSQSTDPFTTWQPHFDRDFASVIDLLSIPLYGYAPQQVAGTSDIDHPQYNPPPGSFDPRQPLVDDADGEARMFRVGGPTKNLLDANRQLTGHRTAAMRILYPEPAALPTGATGRPALTSQIQYHYRNRWHRLLEFVTVPDRSEESIADRLAWKRRTPGKINLNTVRDSSILKGVVDDLDQLGIIDGAGLPSTTDQYDTARDWYSALLSRRDGSDPITGPSVPIPGGINSRPFRPISWIAPSFNNPAQRDQSIEHTILRTLNGGSKFGLWEARNSADPADNSVDFHTRNRLLAKIDNRTTNRSHVFMIWTTVGFFEAHRLATGAAAGEIQIGGEAEDIPRRRAFMVADMSRIEEAYEDPNPMDTDPGYFDFRKFIIYRKLIK